jgi:hypothetical protein
MCVEDSGLLGVVNVELIPVLTQESANTHVAWLQQNAASGPVPTHTPFPGDFPAAIQRMLRMGPIRTGRRSEIMIAQNVILAAAGRELEVLVSILNRRSSDLMFATGSVTGLPSLTVQSFATFSGVTAGEELEDEDSGAGEAVLNEVEYGDGWDNGGGDFDVDGNDVDRE